MDKVYNITMTLKTKVKVEVIARDDNEALDKLNEELYAALDEYTNEGGLLYFSDVSIEEDEEATAMMRADEKMQELKDEV